MTSDVMQAVLTRFNRKLLLEQRKVVLILDNATCHPKSIIDSFSQINEYSSAGEIIKDVNILMAIRWAQEAWKEVTGTTTKNCFEKCGIIKNDDLIEIKEEDL